MNSAQENLLAGNGTFRNTVRSALLKVSSASLHENPLVLDFGSAQGRIEATGRVTDAQVQMSDQRRAFGRQIINSQDAMTIQASNVLAAMLIVELERRGMTAYAQTAEALCMKLVGGQELTDDDQATLDAIVLAVVAHGFSASAGFNVHRWGLESNASE